MIFQTLVLLWMLTLIFLTIYPVHVVWASPKRRFLGFYYDASRKAVIPPAWLLILYSAFFIFFSGSYLYFWNKEISSGNYRFQHFLTDSLLFLGVAYLVTIPLIGKTLERFGKNG